MNICFQKMKEKNMGVKSVLRAGRIFLLTTALPKNVIQYHFSHILQKKLFVSKIIKHVLLNNIDRKEEGVQNTFSRKPELILCSLILKFLEKLLNFPGGSLLEVLISLQNTEIKLTYSKQMFCSLGSTTFLTAALTV